MDSIRNLVKFMLLVTVFFTAGMFSCGKKSDDTGSNKDNGSAEIVSIDEKDLNESDEDLLTVDYQEFYNELAPHGEWIEVTDRDIGVELKGGTASGKSESRKITLSELFGVKDAHAYDDVSFGAFFVWRPSPGLAVGLSVTEPEPTYVPYSNGQWIYTDAGWYFRAASPYEEIVHHHGRWVYSPSLGWLWVPGRVWSPAWVDWRENDDFISWAPIPPSVYIVNDVVIVPPIYEERYIIVENRYFLEPYIYKHHHKEKFWLGDWRRVDGVVVVNNTVIDRGPDVTFVRNVTGKEVNSLSIERVKDLKKMNYSEKELSAYSPDFRKIRTQNKIKQPDVRPDKFVNYGEKSKNHKQERSAGSNEQKGKEEINGNSKNNDSRNDKKGKDNYDNSRNKNKQHDGNLKSGDWDKPTDKRYDKQRNNDRKNGSDKQKGNDKPKGNDRNKGNDNKGNDRNKGNDNKGNDHNKGKDNNGKDSKPKGDNGKSHDSMNIKTNSKNKGRNR